MLRTSIPIRSPREEVIATFITKCGIFIVVTPISFFLAAAAVKLGWLWFVVPLGVSPIGYLHAVGLAMLAGFMARTPRSDKGCAEKDFAENIAEALAAPSVTLLFMWLVHLAM